MMRIKKLWLATIAALWCSLTVSAHDLEVDGIYYNITSETYLTVEVTCRGSSWSSYDDEYNGEINIPSTITYNNNTYRVTSIGESAFEYCSSLTSIIIPESVTSIGSSAFYGCSRLTSITIPESVTSIGNSAFYYCNSLTSITIPESVTSIGNNAFYGCSSLTSITIPKGVTSIGGRTFISCTALKEVIFEDGNELLNLGSISDYMSPFIQGVFRDCPLETVYLGRNLSYSYSSGTFGAYSPFYNKTLLATLTIGENVTSIENYAFAGCSSLTSITIPENVTSIGDCAFSGCSGLTSIIVADGNSIYDSRDGCNAIIEASSNTLVVGCSSSIIPESVTSIEEYAFQGCQSLTSITIPENVMSIGNYAFEDCNNLYRVFNYSNLSLFVGSSDYGNIAYYAKQIIKGDELTTFGDFQFLTSGGVHRLVNYIGKDADIKLPDFYNGMCYSIGNYAFYGCSRLSSITIPEGVESIENYAFDNCTALKKVIIEDGSKTLSLGYNYHSESYKNIGEGLFYDCPLESVYIGRNLSYNSGKWYGYSPFYKDTICPTISLGDNITAIASDLFYGNTALTTITIPKGVTSIGNYAFEGCSRLTSIVVSKGMMSIGRDAFSGCSSLYKVINYSDLPLSTGSSDHGLVAYYARRVINGNELKTVDDFQFRRSYGVYYLENYVGKNTEIILPNDYNGVSYKVGTSAFAGSNLSSITIPKGVEYIEDYAFDNCTALKKVIIEDGSETLSLGYNYYNNEYYGIGEGLFYDCPLESVYMGRNLSYSSGTSSGYSPFHGITGLPTITIGAKVTRIEDYTFYNCRDLTSITIPEGVTSIGYHVFDNCTALKEVIIEDGSKTLSLGYNDDRQGLFYDCPLETVYLGRNLNLFLGTDSVYSPFLYQSGLTSVTIGENVTSIRPYTFIGCARISSITSYAKVPPVCGEQAWQYVNTQECVLRVPKGFASAYKTANQWKDFSFIEDVVEEKYSLTYTVDGEVYDVMNVEYGGSITPLAEPVKEGYTFSGWGEVPATMPAKDVTINGFFTANIYKVYYYVGEKLVYTEEVIFGETIPKYTYIPEANEGKFLGWIADEDHVTMPAKEVIFTAKLDGVCADIEKSEIKNQKSEMIFDLQGRRVLDTENLKVGGVYIINGKKTVIK